MCNDPSMSTADPVCEVCGTTAATIFYPTAQEYLCPQHSVNRALTLAAHDHLVTLLNAAIEGWVLHWGQTVASPIDIAEAVEWAIAEVGSPTFAERRDQVIALLASDPRTASKVQGENGNDL